MPMVVRAAVTTCGQRSLVVVRFASCGSTSCLICQAPLPHISPASALRVSLDRWLANCDENIATTTTTTTTMAKTTTTAATSVSASTCVHCNEISRVTRQMAYKLYQRQKQKNKTICEGQQHQQQHETSLPYLSPAGAVYITLLMIFKMTTKSTNTIAEQAKTKK